MTRDKVTGHDANAGSASYLTRLAGAACAKREKDVRTYGTCIRHTLVMLDKSVTSPEAAMQIVRASACDRVVLKLNRLGGFFPAL